MPTIIAFPKAGILYNVHLYAAMERHGETVVNGLFAMRWLWSHSKRGDVIHLHWPSFAYLRPTKVGVLIGFARWLTIVCIMRLRGIHIFWTAHNVLPHDRAPLPNLDDWGRRFVIRISRHVFVHGDAAGRKLVERFPRAAGKLVLIPHGHWIDAYPVTSTRSAARRTWAIAESTFVFLFIGLCKPYKNLEALIDAFESLEGDVALIIAGRFPDADYQRRVEALAVADARILVRSGYVPHDEVAPYLVACDAVVAPYRETLTSGTAVLAMSYGRPIVSIATGHLLDVVTDDAGVLYDASQPDGLVQAMERARRATFDEAAIVDHVATFTFDEAAALTARTFWSERSASTTALDRR